MQELGAFDEVADDTGVVRNGDAICLLGGKRRSMRVRDRANAADALHDHCSIFGSAVAYNQLHAAEAAAGDPCIGNDAVFDFHFHTQVTLDTGNRVDYCTCHVLVAPFPILELFNFRLVIGFHLLLEFLGGKRSSGAIGVEDGLLLVVVGARRTGTLSVDGALGLELDLALHAARSLDAEAVSLGLSTGTGVRWFRAAPSSRQCAGRDDA